jgi:hypothetical protein
MARAATPCAAADAAATASGCGAAAGGDDVGLALVASPEECGAVTYASPPDALAGALRGLWERGALCDVALVAADGAELPAHRLLLAAACGFFRALFTVRAGAAGAGACGGWGRSVRGARPQGAEGVGCVKPAALKPCLRSPPPARRARAPRCARRARA